MPVASFAFRADQPCLAFRKSKRDFFALSVSIIDLFVPKRASRESTGSGLSPTNLFYFRYLGDRRSLDSLSK